MDQRAKVTLFRTVQICSEVKFYLIRGESYALGFDEGQRESVRINFPIYLKPPPSPLGALL